MSELAQLAVVFGVVFAINLLPAFGPPTWAVLVFFSLDFDLPAVPLVLGGALAAAGGRFVLAHGARRLRPRFSAERRERLDRAEAVLGADRRRTAAGLGLFALSPVPSGQLFVAAGLMTVPLLPLTSPSSAAASSPTRSTSASPASPSAASARSSPRPSPLHWGSGCRLGCSWRSRCCLVGSGRVDRPEEDCGVLRMEGRPVAPRLAR